MDNQSSKPASLRALFKLWLLYAAIGALAGFMVYLFRGDQARVLGIAVFAISVAIGTIIVSAAMFEANRKSRKSKEDPGSN